MAGSLSTLRARRLAVLTLAFLLTLAAAAWPASAQAETPPGWQDTSYGSPGFGGIDSPGVDGTVDSSGRAVMLHGYARETMGVSRLTVAGARDAGFGTDGFGNMTLPGDAWYQRLLVGSDGIYVAGPRAFISGLVVVRLTPNGTLDSTYGSGGVAQIPVPAVIDSVAGLAQLDNGDVVVGVNGQVGSAKRSFVSVITGAGVLDAGWHSTGPIPGMRSMADRIVGVGATGNAAVLATAGTSTGHVLRYAADGAVDGTFGNLGSVALPTAFAARHLDVGVDGDYYVVGTVPSAGSRVLAVVRVLPAGNVDSGFGGSGVAVPVPGFTGTPELSVGRASFLYVFSGLSVLRLTLAGQPDLTYGADGLVAIDNRAANRNFTGGLGGGVQPSGKALVFFQTVDDDAFRVAIAERVNATTAAPPGAYVPLRPSRVLDTRVGIGAARQAVPAGGTLAVTVGGHAGVPAVGTGAVVLNLTAVSATRRGYVTVWPAGAGRPTASNLNYLAGDATANLVTVPLGTAGALQMYNGSSGTVQLVADVIGYYLGGTPTAAGAFASLSPARIVDTRSGVGAPVAPVAAGGTLTFSAAGAGGVPASGVSAVVINATVTNQTAPGYLTIFPSTSPRPTASNLNFYPGGPRANVATVRLGSDGAVTVFNGSTAPLDLVVDVAGYYLDGVASEPGTFVPVDPRRLLDTRNLAHGVLAGADLHVNVQGIPSFPEPTSALVLTATVTQAHHQGYATYLGQFSPASALTATSTVNFAAGRTTANLVITSGKDFGVHNGSAGTIQALADLAGYFQP